MPVVVLTASDKREPAALVPGAVHKAIRMVVDAVRAGQTSLKG